jgi:AraC-like DNA-binding protein
VLYTEFPLADLGLDTRRIDALWLFLAEAPGLQRVLPDGHADVMVRFRRSAQGSAWNETISNLRLAVAGPTLETRDVPAQAHTGAMGIRFRRGWGGVCLGVACHALRDRVLLNEEAEAVIAEHAAAIKSARTVGELKTTLVAVARSLTAHAEPSEGQRLAIAAIELLERATTRLDAASLCRELGVAERTLRREVLSAVGVPLRSLAVLTRFHRAVAMLRNTDMALDETALEAGYSDQSHMNREFRRLGGFTPGKPMDVPLLCAEHKTVARPKRSRRPDA